MVVLTSPDRLSSLLNSRQIVSNERTPIETHGSKSGLKKPKVTIIPEFVDGSRGRGYGRKAVSQYREQQPQQMSPTGGQRSDGRRTPKLALRLDIEPDATGLDRLRKV